MTRKLDSSPTRTGVPRYTKPSAPSKPEEGLSGPTIDPGLYVVATPIGNLRDITLRAIDVLRAAELIACEDTRITRRLCEAYDITGKLVAYHDHNGEKVRPGLLKALADGKVVAQVSDAGTPVVSDPGYRLVREATAAGFDVRAIPGASAPLTALAASGLPSDGFFFGGFLPAKQGGRRARINELSTIPGTLILFETGPRLAASLRDMAHAWGDREAAVMRELTKRFEEHRRGSVAELAVHYGEAPSQPKGEIVVLVGPPSAVEELDDGVVEDLLVKALGTMSVKDAAASVAAMSGRPRKALYAMALGLAKRPDETS